MTTSQYIQILLDKAIQLESGNIPESEIPNVYLIFKNHNLIDIPNETWRYNQL